MSKPYVLFGARAKQLGIPREVLTMYCELGAHPKPKFVTAKRLGFLRSDLRGWKQPRWQTYTACGIPLFQNGGGEAA